MRKRKSFGVSEIVEEVVCDQDDWGLLEDRFLAVSALRGFALVSLSMPVEVLRGVQSPMMSADMRTFPTQIILELERTEDARTRVRLKEAMLNETAVIGEHDHAIFETELAEMARYVATGEPLRIDHDQRFLIAQRLGCQVSLIGHLVWLIATAVIFWRVGILAGILSGVILYLGLTFGIIPLFDRPYSEPAYDGAQPSLEVAHEMRLVYEEQRQSLIDAEQG